MWLQSDHICPILAKVKKYTRNKNWAPAIATNYEQPFPLRYFEVAQLQFDVSAAQTNELLHGTTICK
jgi:hypothetical protein